MASPRPGLLAGLTLPTIFGLLFLVLPLQELAGGPVARLLLFGLVFLGARRLAATRSAAEDRMGFVRPRASTIAYGLALGAGLVTVVVAVLAAAGWYALTWSGAAGAVVSALVWGVAVGLYEEALFRSLWFGGLEPVFGTWLTLVVSAVFFGLVHWFNPEATLLSSLAIGLTAGVLLGALFILRRDLWVVAGVHAAWNSTLGGCSGCPCRAPLRAGRSSPPPKAAPTCGPVDRSAGGLARVGRRRGGRGSVVPGERPHRLVRQPADLAAADGDRTFLTPPFTWGPGVAPGPQVVGLL